MLLALQSSALHRLDLQREHAILGEEPEVLVTAANHLGVWPAAIFELERETRRHDELAQAYRAWLSIA